MPALRSPVDPPHHLLREATEPRFGGRVRLESEVAIDCALQTPPPRKRSERREQEPLNGIGRPPKAELPAKAGGKQRTEQRRRAPLGVRMPIGAASASRPR